MYYFECIYVNKTLIKSLIYTSDNSTYSLTQHENSVPSMLSYRALTVYIYIRMSIKLAVFKYYVKYIIFYYFIYIHVYIYIHIYSI